VVQQIVTGVGGRGDMFLSVSGARAGAIKGEAQDAAHANEIDVLSWSWGMQGRSTIGTSLATGRATVHELKIVKRVDSATTPLMSALRNNEVITKAVLTVRKSGGSKLEYLKITIEQGRVTSIAVEGGSPDESTDVFENVSFSFNKITVEYVPQGKDGQPRGSMLYNDQIDERA
jgi:type VI secretion system secreted protein Hcp